MNERFPQYTTDYISGVMSLREPQKQSLKILEEIASSVSLRKDLNLKAALGAVRAMYPTCTNFEREFLSLTFALATGVGKTRLMGAFIAYLYARHGIRNFFVVAPSTTIYDKLKRDLTDTSSPKYVFQGLGCFSTPPQIITDDDYRQKKVSLFSSDINLFVYNIDKFNKEGANMKKVNEVLGDSFYKVLSDLPDLVVLMDESHHYRAERGMQAINELHPLLGLELTATPLVAKGTKQVPFKNVVYEYPLSRAIADGYTRTPYAVTRSDMKFQGFGDEQIDKLMLTDGITCHENTRNKLQVYAAHHGKPVVKPFMLVVCKDTDHAAWVYSYVTSDNFRDGAYRNKTITVHSKQKGSETEANTRLLLGVENPDNPVEIVIHVNMLKEGWDVNNLYTIVPLRTAASKILREQMVGRGLRLPYGERVGDRDVDAVMLTAHDKFNEILEEAQKGDSIFKASHVIHVEELEPTHVEATQLSLAMKLEVTRDAAYQRTGLARNAENDRLIDKTNEYIRQETTDHIRRTNAQTITQEDQREIVERAAARVQQDKEIGEHYRENKNALEAWALTQTEETHKAAVARYIPIPHLRVTDAGIAEYHFIDFDLNVETLTQAPLPNELLIQRLDHMQELRRVQGDALDAEGYQPEKHLLELLREKPEIDYEACSALLYKLITQACNHFKSQYGSNGMKNIIMLEKRDIARTIYEQMLQHAYQTHEDLVEEVMSVQKFNFESCYGYTQRRDLYEEVDKGALKSTLFDGIEKGVFRTAKFDSCPELALARLAEKDPDVLNWLRPAPQEFNITYNNGKGYEPDFVIETKDAIYLVEVKGEDKLNDADVIAKKKRSVQYCNVATQWNKANGYKEWRHLFIPAQQIQPSSSFTHLSQRFWQKTES